MRGNSGWVTPSERPAPATGAGSQKIYQCGNKGEGSGRRAANQAAHQRRAAEYRQAARRNAEAGRELGGQHGFALISLAGHFARRAHLHAVAAGGAA